MKAALICATVVVASLMFTKPGQAQTYLDGAVGSGLPYFGYGYSGSLYGLGFVPVPPYYALHPPVYYSHEIRRRPVGDSPYAYPARRPAPEPKRQFSLNPFVPDTIIDDGAQPTAQETDAVANTTQNPFYDRNSSPQVGTNLIANPYYAKPEAVVAQTTP